MKLELTPASSEDVPTGPPAMRTQRSGRVVAVLDGDAHLRVWEPNVGADRIDIDLTKTLALVIDLGVDAPPAPTPHWTDSDDSTTLIVSLDAGAHGVITVGGHRVSEDAAVSLAADGFVRLAPRCRGRQPSTRHRRPRGRRHACRLSRCGPGRPRRRSGARVVTAGASHDQAACHLPQSGDLHRGPGVRRSSGANRDR